MPLTAAALLGAGLSGVGAARADTGSWVDPADAWDPLDIRAYGLTLDGGRISATFEFARYSASLWGAQHANSFGVYLDIEDPIGADWQWVMYKHRSDVVHVARWNHDDSVPCASTSVTVHGNTVTLSIPSTCVGDPQRARAVFITSHQDSMGDDAPDRGQHGYTFTDWVYAPPGTGVVFPTPVPTYVPPPPRTPTPVPPVPSAPSYPPAPTPTATPTSASGYPTPRSTPGPAGSAAPTARPTAEPTAEPKPAKRAPVARVTTKPSRRLLEIDLDPRFAKKATVVRVKAGRSWVTLGSVLPNKRGDAKLSVGAKLGKHVREGAVLRFVQGRSVIGSAKLRVLER
ncbi:PT domain-containing protein [Motilibacter aurantiacus]|uniref:PT domain-containing protein n=1 Tax=Motilibacter aurantiacus TaxID=2714955 RepID=UPI001408998C|nr:PT domain-containing protein [Motilibacter aurantiacus]NHC46948.1 hypothetical protein [Motilibacter aurantiacus]